MLRFLHISDIHFDAVYGRYPEVVRSALKSGVFRAFENAVDFAIDESLDAILITGDLCDRGQASYTTESYLRKQMERLIQSGIEVIVLHGNHDPSSELKWSIESEGVHFITGPECCEIEFELKSGQRCFICANGFANKAEYLSRIETFPERNKEDYYIGAMHTYTASGLSTSDHEPYMKTNLSELTSKKYDYWALGHIHKMQLWPAHKVAYSGSLQGLHAREVGEKGGILVEIEAPKAQPNLTFVDFSVLEFQSVFVDVEEDQETSVSNVEMSIHEIKNRIYTEIEKMKAQRKKKKSYLVRVFLEGQTKQFDNLTKVNLVKEIENDVREESEVLFVEIVTERIKPFINKEEILLASPFAKFIDEMLKDQDTKRALTEYAMTVPFAEKPKDEIEWLERLVDQVGDEWLYKMVKRDEN